MSQQDHQFRVVLRGYDPADVDRAMADLQNRVIAAEHGAEGLRSQLQEAQGRAEAVRAERSAEAEAAQAPVQPATFENLGARVGQILSLAEEEAAEMRDSVRAELESLRKEAEQAALAVRDDADRYADQRAPRRRPRELAGADRRPPGRG